MNLTEELTNAMLPHEVFRIPVLDIPVTDTVINMWIVMAVIIVLAIVFTRKLEMVPKGKQNFVELIVEFINNLVRDAIGHHWRPFAPYMGTVLLFLLLSNIISIFNFIPIPHFHLRPPTKDINVTACLAIMTILIVIFAGIRYKRMGGWLKHFLHPLPMMLPFNILDYAIKPLSLCLRLFGNILAAFVIMELVYLAIPPIIPGFLSLYFDLFDGILQAYIFVFLSSLYIGEAVE
ncbi:MAG: F0F1 ATP synthase subunit A [Clostridia bacterium]|nr:F0F1 ATP synthase subunit A [Clostridia bacterium]